MPKGSGLEDAAMEGRCKVVVRIRPRLDGEGAAEEAVSVLNRDGEDENAQHLQVLIPPKRRSNHAATAGDGGAGPATARDAPGAREQQAREFTFDRVLGPSASQNDVGDAVGLDAIVDAALAGYSKTIFAFGQTGSGKTHSICGPALSFAPGGATPASAGHGDGDATWGLLERAARLCFSKAASLRSGSGTEVRVDVTCVEIYQEQVTDLFIASQERRVLPVRHHPRDGFYVQGLTQRQCEDPAAFRRTIAGAFQRRRLASHSLNDASTRSHLLTTLQVTSRPTAARDASPATEEGGEGGGEGPLGLATYGRICFVDLAGSERLGDTRNEASARVTRAETGSINKSLFALGKVLSMIGSESGRPGSRQGRPLVPFRDSKLTQLLMDSLQGKGSATMLACCSPLTSHADVTLSTLHYACLAQKVKSDPVVIRAPQDQLVLDLRQTILDLKTENRRLASQLTALTIPGGPAMGLGAAEGREQGHANGGRGGIEELTSRSRTPPPASAASHSEYHPPALPADRRSA